MSKSKLPIAYEANLREKLKKSGQSSFWQLLHLKDPKTFIFGTKTQLVCHLAKEMEILERFSSEIHRKCVEERNRYIERPNPLHQPEVNISTIQTSLHRIFDLESENPAHFSWFHPKFLQKIIQKTAKSSGNLWAEPKFQTMFKRTFFKFLLENRLWLKEKEAELMAKGVFDWVQLMVAQVWHLQKHLFSSEFVPPSRQWFRSEMAVNECFFGKLDMLRAVKRVEDERNLFCFLQSTPDRDDSRVVIDYEFLKILPENFKFTLKNWLLDVKIASNRVFDEKQREAEPILRDLRPTQPLHFWELSPVLRQLLVELLNNSHLRVFDGQWEGYIVGMVEELGTSSLDDVRDDKEEEMNGFGNVVGYGNPSLYTQLSRLLPNSNPNELRTVLAQLLRFCCNFTGNLMRFLFSMDWSEDGMRIVEISFIPYGNHLDCVEAYDHGEYPERKREYWSPVFSNDFDFDAYFDDPEDAGVRTREWIAQTNLPTTSRSDVSRNHEIMIKATRIGSQNAPISSSRRERILRKITAEWAEDEAELMDFKKTTRTRRHHTPGGSRIQNSSRQNQESTRIRRHHTPRGSRIRTSSRANRQEGVERKEKIRRRHHTPAPPRISTPAPNRFFGEFRDPKMNLVRIDNDSNEFIHEEMIFELHPWILYNYPIIPTVVNNETPDFVN